jgi:hypothetical protein
LVFLVPLVHSGCRASVKLVAESVVDPELDVDVEAYVQVH